MAKVLIIEDEKDVRELYRLVLEDAGHEILGGFDAPQAAMTALEDAGQIPEVIILDERLSGESGTACLPALRDAFPGVRVLVATADPEAAAGACKQGADLAREKPFPVAELADLVERLSSR